MSLANVVRGAVAIADSVTSTLRDAVTHRAWTGVDDNGDATFAAGVAIEGIVDIRDRRVPSSGDQESLSTANITFLRPIAANGAAGRREPIDPRDEFDLPDGRTGPILHIEGGLADPSTGKGYFARVFLG